MKTNAVLFIYGVGGHKEQMKRLLSKLNLDELEINKLALIEKKAKLDNFDLTIEIPPARDKYSKLKTLVRIPYFLFFSVFIILKLLFSYKINTLISTGPGIAFIPAIIFKLLGKEIIFIETWSRFNTYSMTGKLMYKISNKFYVQNKDLLKLYPNAIYAGRL